MSCYEFIIPISVFGKSEEQICNPATDNTVSSDESVKVWASDESVCSEPKKQERDEVEK